MNFTDVRFFDLGPDKVFAAGEDLSNHLVAGETTFSRPAINSLEIKIDLDSYGDPFRTKDGRIFDAYRSGARYVVQQLYPEILEPILLTNNLAGQFVRFKFVESPQGKLYVAFATNLANMGTRSYSELRIYDVFESAEEKKVKFQKQYEFPAPRIEAFAPAKLGFWGFAIKPEKEIILLTPADSSNQFQELKTGLEFKVEWSLDYSSDQVFLFDNRKVPESSVYSLFNED